MYRVGILTTSVDNSRALRLAEAFADPIFDPTIHSFNIPSMLPSLGSITVSQAQDNYRFRKYLESSVDYCDPIIVIFDYLLTASSPALVAKYVAEAMTDYRMMWKVFYLHRWYDNCSSYKNNIQVPNTTVNFVSLAVPYGGLSTILSKEARAALLAHPASTAYGWSRSFESILMEMAVDQTLSTMAISPNLFSPEIIENMDFRLTAECAPPVTGSVSSDGNAMWLLIWLAVAFGVAAIVVFFFLNR